MKASELRAKDIAGLEKEVADLLKAHFGLRMQKGNPELEQPHGSGQHPPRHRSCQDHPGAEEERGREMSTDVTPVQTEAKPKNTRTLIGEVVSDKRSEDDHRAGRAPHQARAVRQDRRQVVQVPRPR
jgi:hypothetical protein